jgi:sulfite dehydrogenase (quinone) subunit SoeC
MHPAWSVIIFTTVAGAAQGLVVLLALATLLGLPLAAGYMNAALLVALLMLLVGLGASFLHLGHPLRAWRAVAMWRTSWLSREVIVLPAFIAVVALWWLLLRTGNAAAAGPAIAVLAIVLAALLWYCTAMIYACIRFIQEWAHALTVINYTLIGLASGLVLAAALAVVTGEPAMGRQITRAALTITLLAWLTRWLALRRNASLKPKSTLQSATGIQSTKLVQKSMGMSAGSFNTREFFHGASAAAVRHVRLALHGLGFLLPALLMMLVLHFGAPPSLLPLALLLQAAGLLAERWLFFAQARHPQNLYYQTVS